MEGFVHIFYLVGKSLGILGERLTALTAYSYIDSDPCRGEGCTANRVQERAVFRV